MSTYTTARMEIKKEARLIKEEAKIKQIELKSKKFYTHLDIEAGHYRTICAAVLGFFLGMILCYFLNK